MTQIKSEATQPVSGAAAPLRAGWFLAALAPLLLLGALIAAVVVTGAGLNVEPAGPLDALTFERVTFPDEREVAVVVRNSGPTPVKISTVYVDEAVWEAWAHPSAEIGRLRSATIRIPYRWVEGEPVHIKLLTENAVAFEHEVAAAAMTPGFSLETAARYALIGTYVGFIPVGLGLLWYPFLRRIGTAGLHAALALTAGLLVFLAIDTLGEALEVAALVAGPFHASILVWVVAGLAVLGLLAAGRRSDQAGGGDPAQRRLRIAWLIALGIGLHNLGEGLAIGAAYALGEAALGAFLIIGFTLHNITEGIGIAAPIARDPVRLRTFIGLAALGGGPAILGTWVGGFTYSPFLSALFLAAGTGAVVQVIYEVGKLMYHDSRRQDLNPLSAGNLAGLALGIAIMWITGMLV